MVLITARRTISISKKTYLFVLIRPFSKQDLHLVLKSSTRPADNVPQEGSVMQVTRYQMHNVLECYSKKLSRVRGKENVGIGSGRKFADEITLSSDTSRLAAMDKISRQVLDKVMDVVALSSTGILNRYSTRASDAVVGGAGAMEFSSTEVDPIDR